MGRASLAAASASSRRAWSTVWAASCSRRSASAILALASASIPGVRNIIPIGIPRGVNNLWNNCGLHYAPPIR